MIRMKHPLHRIVLVLFGLGLMLSGCSSNEPPKSQSNGPFSRELIADADTTKSLSSSRAVQRQSDAIAFKESDVSSIREAEEQKSIESVVIEPSSPVTGDRLAARVSLASSTQASTTLVYRWKKNGQTVQESPSEVLQSPINREDFIEIEVLTSLSDPGSANVVSSYVTVGNAPPTMRLSNQAIGNDGVYQAKVESSDPEGDNFSLSIKEGPPGMTIDPQGSIRWTPDSKAEGTFSVAISARDIHAAETSLTYQIKINRVSNGKAS